MTENLPFNVDARDLVEDEIVDDGIKHGDILYDQLLEDLLIDADGLDRGIIMLHLWHRQSRWLIDHGVGAQVLTSALKKVQRASVKAAKKTAKIEAFIAKQG